MERIAVIVGRPNVGKSTLFNRLTGQRRALVHPQPGMTRDWKQGRVSLNNLDFSLIDTPGIRDFTDDPLSQDMERQTTHAIEQGNLILFVVDAHEGLTPVDREIALWLRKKNKPMILLVNKSERKGLHFEDMYTLGFDEVVALSAQEGLGIDDLYHALKPYIEPNEGETEDEKPLFQLAIVGRPNAGKSTLINAMLGEDRLITSPIAGSTRDSIALTLSWRGKIIQLIDTAGMRRATSIKWASEKMAVEDARRAIQYAQVVALMVDATTPLEAQDLSIARHVIEEGRAFFVIVNKIDLISNLSAFKKAITDKLTKSLAQIKKIEVLYIAARNDKQYLRDQVLDHALKLYQKWGTRISTGQLNRWLAATVAQHEPPLHQGRRIKLRYMTQIKSRPPTFALFLSQTETLPQSYLNYLENQMRQDFGLFGIPLRLLLRKKHNPYD